MADKNSNRVRNVDGTVKNTRVKDDHTEHNHGVDGLSDNMKGFYNELTALFPELRVTSAYRTSSPSGGFSHHHTGDAIDIGKEHSNVFEYLNNTREGLELMNKYGLGILDETDPRSMQKTHATGPHFHIGKDSGLFATTQNRLEQFDFIQPMQSFYSQNPNFDYNDINNLEGANLNLYGTYNPEQDVILEGPGTDGQVSPFRLVLPNQEVAEYFIGELKKEEEKEKIKNEKEQESEYRKLIEQKKAEEQQKMQQVISTMEQVRMRDEDSMKREDLTDKYALPQVQQPNVSVQRNLPNLPSIFNI